MLVSLESITRPTRDAIAAAQSLDSNQIRFLVDAYYQMQDNRIATASQIRSIDQSADKGAHETLDWLLIQQQTMEDQIKRALDVYSQSHLVGPWLRGVYGIGPVTASGLLAHIDIRKAPTVGHIWRFAGLDPTLKWNKKTKRPWNADLKTICWKIGQSFMKFSNQPACYYGNVYRERKAYEVARNEAMGNMQAAAEGVARVGKTTEAFKAYSIGKLPAGKIDAQARRYAVKLLLSHLHGVWFKLHFGTEPPLPYPIAVQGHAHYIEPPQ